MAPLWSGWMFHRISVENSMTLEDRSRKKKVVWVAGHLWDVISMNFRHTVQRMPMICWILIHVDLAFSKVIEHERWRRSRDQPKRYRVKTLLGEQSKGKENSKFRKSFQRVKQFPVTLAHKCLPITESIHRSVLTKESAGDSTRARESTGGREKPKIRNNEFPQVGCVDWCQTQSVRALLAGAGSVFIGWKPLCANYSVPVGGGVRGHR